MATDNEEIEQETEDTETETEETETPIKCTSCDKVIADGDDNPEYNGKTYCESCFDEEFIFCERCEETAPEENSKTVTTRGRTNRRTEQTWCKSCVDNYAVHCDDCRCYVDRDMSMGDNSLTICDSCYENGGYCTCEDCGELTSDPHEYHDSYYCASCVPSRDEDEDEDEESETHSSVHAYSYKPRAEFFPPRARDSKELYYGVELEIEATGLDRAVTHTLATLNNGREHVYLKEDGSLGTGGFEIVSHPHTLAAHRELWTAFFANIPKGMYSYKSGACGLHVHVGRNALSPYLIGKLLVFVNSDANRAFIETIAQRATNDYCAIKHKKLSDCRYSSSRYEAVNINNTATIEFRIFRGNTRGDRFFKALEFVDALIHWTRDASAECLRYQDFIKYVRANRKSYGVLDAYLVEKGYLPAMKSQQGKLPLTATVESEDTVCA